MEVCKFALNIPIFYTNFLEEDKQQIPVRITTHRHNSRGTTPIVQEKHFSMPAWSSSTVDSKRKSLDLCLLNARSVRNKTLAISDFTTDLNIDIMALTETWLNSGDEAFITELCPEGFKFIHAPRNNKNRGGGVGLLFKKNLQMKKKLCDSFLSFECMDILLLNLINVRIFVIYRPPPSQVNGLSVSLFFAEFSQFLEHIVILPETILILGDFNLHVNAADDVNGKRFLDLLLSFNLKQHVLCPTYNGRYTLDLMITRSDDLFVSDVCTSDIVISDHSPVLCHLNLVKPLSKTKFVNFRNLKSLCLDSFKRDISVSLACVDNSDISKLVSHYHEVLASTLNTHAPLKRRAVTVRVKKAPWYTPEIDLQKKVRRRYERRWRSTGLPSDKQKFSKQCAVVNKMLFLSKQQYFNSVVADNENDQHSLFKTVSNLLYPKQSPQYPPSSDDTCLANSFIQFFTDKIKGIRQGFFSCS